MNGWIRTAGTYIFASWRATAHEDDDAEFDAGEFAAGPGQDWFYECPTPEEDPTLFQDWGDLNSLADAWLAAHVAAAQIYGEIVQSRALAKSLLGINGKTTADLWIALYNDPDVDCGAHAVAVVSRALGYGSHDPAPPVGGIATPSNAGSWLEFEANPFV